MVSVALACVTCSIFLQWRNSVLPEPPGLVADLSSQERTTVLSPEAKDKADRQRVSRLVWIFRKEGRKRLILQQHSEVAKPWSKPSPF